MGVGKFDFEEQHDFEEAAASHACPVAVFRNRVRTRHDFSGADGRTTTHRAVTKDD